MSTFDSCRVQCLTFLVGVAVGIGLVVLPRGFDGTVGGKGRRGGVAVATAAATAAAPAAPCEDCMGKEPMGFGKYSHLTYEEVYATDRNYVDWCITVQNPTRFSRFVAWAACRAKLDAR